MGKVEEISLGGKPSGIAITRPSDPRDHRPYHGGNYQHISGGTFGCLSHFTAYPLHEMPGSGYGYRVQLGASFDIDLSSFFLSFLKSSLS